MRRTYSGARLRQPGLDLAAVSKGETFISLSLVARVLSVFRRLTIVIAIAIAFLFGVVTTVYLSLRSPEVTVPDVVGKDRFEAEKILADADLKFRVRATRPNKSKPDTVLFQLPRPGEVVKAGQTVAMDISRATKEGETPETVKPVETNSNRNTNASANANENKPKKPKNKNENENTNGNANANSNGNANKAANANRTPNANRPNVNAGADNTNTTPRTNSNTGENSNSSPAANQNVNRSPVAPKPSPSTSNSNRQLR